MNIPQWFRHSRPTLPPVQVSSSDRLVAALNHYTPEEWDALPEIARKDCREHVAWKMASP